MISWEHRSRVNSVIHLGKLGGVPGKRLEVDFILVRVSGGHVAKSKVGFGDLIEG